MELHNPLLEFLGVVATSWRDGHIEMQLPLQPHMLNRSGVVHGGIICTMLDAAGGYCGLHSREGDDRRHGVTLSLTTNFLNNGVGKILTAKGTIDRRGRAIYFSRAEVWLDDDLLVATAIGTYRYLKSEAVAS